ncbi:MAG TPA: hypothetical protein DCX89_03455 [Saprospirales bacterium]|nr:hypothetical protein [Saprospirales bacterium]
MIEIDIFHLKMDKLYDDDIFFVIPSVDQICHNLNIYITVIPFPGKFRIIQHTINVLLVYKTKPKSYLCTLFFNEKIYQNVRNKRYQST